MTRDRRGQLDALLDVELVLPRADGPDVATVVDSENACAALRPPPPSLAPGMHLGKYRLERLLGFGGMGMVWEARDVDLDRAIALKVLKPALAGSDVARSRLVREARAMARLHHPNVITIFDVTTVDGHVVIAMELIEGTTMARWIRRAPPRELVVAALVAAGRGLAAAHAAGMIHRDFKPHNVLVDPGGRVVVGDFGLVRTVGDTAHEPEPGRMVRGLDTFDSALTASGTVVGTPAYMAPEQLTRAPADARADQFAFCATAWEALTGERPYAGETAAEVWAGFATDRLRATDRVPRRLRPILERGLLREPAARWPSVDALLDAMMHAWRRPRRIAIALGVAAGLAALAAAVLVLRRVPWQPRVIDLPAFEENSDGPAISPDGTQIAYASDREHAGKARVYVATLPDGESRAITPAGQHFQTPRWTRDGTALLLVRHDAEARRYRIVRQPIAGGPYTDVGTGLGADDCGDAIAIADGDNSVAQIVLQYAGGTRQVLIESRLDWFTLPRCDRAGERIVFTRGPSAQADPVNDVSVIDRAGKETSLTRDHAAISGTFTPDGRSVVLAAMRDGKIELFEVAVNGGEVHQLTFDDAPHSSPDVSSDGRTVAFNLDSSTKVVMAGEAGDVRKLTTKRQNLEGLVPTRDGKYLVAQRRREQRDEIIVISTVDGSDRVLVDGRNPFPSFDDERVLFGTNDPPRLLAIPIGGGEPTVLADLPGSLMMGADGPDGPEIAVNRDGVVEAWWVTRDGHLEPRGIRALVIPAPAGGWRAVQTSSDGYQLRFVAPGEPLTAGAHVVVPESNRPMWLDDHRISYAARGAFHVVDVTTGIEVATVPGPAWGQRAVLASDGVHWYDLSTIGHVTRHLLVNFADRRGRAVRR